MDIFSLKNVQNLDITHNSSILEIFIKKKNACVLIKHAVPYYLLYLKKSNKISSIN